MLWHALEINLSDHHFQSKTVDVQVHGTDQEDAGENRIPVMGRTKD
jgi:hypothetical protein